MAKIGLAAELAKQAAQAARDEMTATEGVVAPSGAPKKPEPWKPAELPTDFRVDAALGRAVGQVAAHYSRVLKSEGLGMTVVTDLSQGVPHFQADLTEGGTGRVVKAYTAPDLLSMFAFQQRVNGVVVDGQV